MNNTYIKNLLSINKKAFQFLHDVEGFDFEKPYFITQQPGKFTAKAREVVETSEKPLMFRYGFAYRGAEKRPITREKALSIIDDSGNYLDITETDNEILLNTFSSNDMW